MDVASHIEAIDEEGQLMAEAARRAGLDAGIDGCPGWTVRDLVRHVSEIHLWAAAHVALRATKMWVEDVAELTEAWPDLGVFWPADDELPEHYLRTNANLVRELEGPLSTWTR